MNFFREISTIFHSDESPRDEADEVQKNNIPENDESERYLMSHHLLTNEQRLDKKQKKQIEKAKKAEKAVTLSERCG